jgi:hypothetical protein
METKITNIPAGAPSVRHGYQLDIAGTKVHWYEMDHPHERVPTFLTMFESYIVRNNWNLFIRPGSTCIDIGGHSGDTAIPMQYLARGTVLSIEPNLRIKEYLDFNVGQNSDLGRFVTAAVAVTIDNIEEVEILDHNNDLCNGGMIDQSWSLELQTRMRNMSTKSIKVPGRTLETICKDNLSKQEIDNISFVKTDTEGHDVSIIESSGDFLLKTKPVIFTEWFFAYTAVETQRLFDVFASMEYLIFDPVTLQPADIRSPIPDLVCVHKTDFEMLEKLK